MKPVKPKQKEKPKATVGAIVARFQVHELHKAHRDLIQFLLDNHSKVIIFLGVNGSGITTKNNPLDYTARLQMIRDAFPDNNKIIVVPQVNQKYNSGWSSTLDAAIKAIIGPADTVQLYGGRDSFIRHYEGRYPTQVLESDTIVSGTAVRADVMKSTLSSKEFRMGVIWGAGCRYPAVFPTVDIIMLEKTDKGDRVALAKKNGEEGYRCIGGFVDPSDSSLEEAAMREASEETGISMTSVQYIGSYKIKDWRYRGEQDGIMTSLFVGWRTFGSYEAKDDIAEIKLFTIKELATVKIEEEHAPLVARFLEWYKDQEETP